MVRSGRPCQDPSGLFVRSGFAIVRHANVARVRVVGVATAVGDTVVAQVSSHAIETTKPWGRTAPNGPGHCCQNYRCRYSVAVRLLGPESANEVLPADWFKSQLAIKPSALTCGTSPTRIAATRHE